MTKTKTEVANVTFPEPWSGSDTIYGYRIEPVTTPALLSRYANQLKNGAAEYAKDVASGDCSVYTVFEGDALVAMFKLRGYENSTQIGFDQLSGSYNKDVPDRLREAVGTYAASANVWRNSLSA